MHWDDGSDSWELRALLYACEEEAWMSLFVGHFASHLSFAFPWSLISHMLVRSRVDSSDIYRLLHAFMG